MGERGRFSGGLNNTGGKRQWESVGDSVED